MQLAIDAIRQEQCEAAIVAGAHLNLTPTAALQFLRLGMLSDKGSCRSFDASGLFMYSITKALTKLNIS